jgi:hypothetical protein
VRKSRHPGLRKRCVARQVEDSDGWTVQTNHLSETCKVIQLEIQQVSVPAGTFGATEITCTWALDSAGTHYNVTYWYSADVGAMVKVERRKVDSSGSKISSASEQLQIYERASIGIPGAHRPGT